MKLASCKMTPHYLRRCLLRGASVGALAALVVAPVWAETSDTLETVVVTGSRVISSAAKSPTPLTVVNIEDLQLTAPSSIPDGLNKLPVFQGSAQPRTAGNGSSAGGMNVLNLRNFGVQRTLVLLDGHRVPPSSADGTVDIDTLPQMLMAHVDVVTGGASAVYGSDAVTGVVNFILDKKFTGLKVDANVGISTYADGASYNLGLAAGGDVLGGRGHIEGSVRHFQQDGVRLFDRPYGSQVWMLTGTGSAANPFTFSNNIRRADYAWGGKITCSSCSVSGQQFLGAGQIGPFVPGTTTGTGNQNSGGDGAASKYGSASTNVRTNEAFGRFSYDVDSSTTFYVQAIAAEQFASGWWFPTKLSHDATATFYKNNPYLTAAEQTQLGNNGLSDSTNTFAVGEYFDLGPTKLVGTRNANRNLSLTAGLDGTLFGDYTWDVFYTHGENRQAVDVVNNTNYQKQYAALDAVLGSGGSAQCYAATQAASAGDYAACVPMNPFGPGLMSAAAYNYITATTWYHQTNILNDVGGSVAGTVLENWAGPVKVAVSAEARFNDYKVDSNASPTATVNCTGLRICSSSTPLWAQNVVAAVEARNNVWEFAAEADVPLLKDLPLVQSLNVNMAGRYTDYSTSGSVQTWKIGVDYHVNDQLRFRGTTSVDIRAPTLNDLFSPLQKSTSSYNDTHTGGTAGSVLLASQGNAALVPEVARTYTMGVVATPEFIPGLVASLDYYNIKLKNAIGTIDGRANDIQHLCEISSGTSTYCSLYVRPFGFSNTSAANYPTTVYKQYLNTALAEIEGFDFEANYAFQMADLIDQAKGAWNVRLLANYQPVDQSQAYPGAPMSYLGPSNGLNDLQTWKVSKTHVTAFLRYNLGDWSFVLQDRWHGGFSTKTAPGQVWVTPHMRSVNYVDATVSRDFTAAGGDFTSYLSVQNMFNSRSAVYPNSGSVSLYYPVTPEEDVMGRYFTLGIRAKF